MDSLRIHTFYLDIRGIKKLKLENVYDFIADKLLLTEADVAAIQPDLAESKVYVECHSLEKAEEVVRRFDGSQELVNNGEVHKIKLQMEDGATEVKIYHLPPRMPNEEITRFMESYGEILSIRNETCKSKRFANTPNGVRMVRIRLRKQIPSFISVKGYSTYVTYSNQIQTCKHCGDCVHYGTSCGENRVNKAATGRAQISYADIASGSVTSSRSGASGIEVPKIPALSRDGHNLNSTENKRPAPTDGETEPAKKATPQTQTEANNQLQIPTETKTSSVSSIHTIPREERQTKQRQMEIDEESDAGLEKRLRSRKTSK